jgi:uncharacterized protein (DUF488 family)
MKRVGERRPRLFTIGHSDRTLDQLLRLLESSSARLVADVRSNPASSRFPHFERHALARSLDARGMVYRWFRSLGGRVTEPVEGEAEHTALESPSLRRYAARMNTPAFTAVCEELLGLAASTVAVLLCAERDFRSCHRRLLSDKLQIMGARVVHIVDATCASEHSLHPELTISEEMMVYTARQLRLID